MTIYEFIIGGFDFVVDEIDAPLVEQYNWKISKRGDAVYLVTYQKTKPRTIYMHRLIINAEIGQTVDHINRNPRDNRRVNLRICTPSENNANRDFRIGKSGYFGVMKNALGYRAQIQKDNIIYRTKQLSLLEAAKQYDALSVLLFGVYGRRNFPNDVPPDINSVKFSILKHKPRKEPTQ